MNLTKPRDGLGVPLASIASKPAAPWLMLVSRSAVFLAFQLLIAGVFVLLGHPTAFDESARWWTFVAALTNLVSIYLLVRLFAVEGKRYRDILRFSRATVKTDLLWLLGSALIGLPIAMAPMNPLATVLFGDAMVPVHMLFRPLSPWAFILGFLFPLTIAFAELPTYFGYVMPRLAAQLKSSWGAWALASLFLAVQHGFLPFIPDGRYLFWRIGMYLPFAFFAGLVLKLRPTLLPYLIILHALMDVSTMMVYLTI